MKSWHWLILGGFVLLAISGGFMVTGNWPDIVKRFAEAIASAEGYFISGSVPNRRNNPGDLSDASGVIQYPTPEAGWQALYHQVNLMFFGDPSQTRYNSSMTITQVAQTYAENWQNWAQNVAGYLGVSPDTKLSDLT
jgi:hypothetical protein